MRSINYLFFSFFFFVNAKAQQNHFVYIQAENRQAFYVKLNEKIFSSSASGYLIIPKLTDGPYKLNIGFPKNEWPSQNIDIAISDKDEGFLLKNFEAKGWGLFNIQTMEILVGTGISAGTTSVTQNKTDDFSNTLAEVTNTPSIRLQDPIKPVQETVLAGSAVSVIAADSAKTAAGEEIKKADSVNIIPATQISKLFSIIDSSGRSVIYVVNEGNNADSIRVFIPYDNKEIEPVIKVIETPAKAETKQDSIVALETLTVLPVKKDSIENTLQPVNNEVQKPVANDSIAANVKPVVITAVNSNQNNAIIINTSCTSSATDEDYLKLHKKMATTDNDEAMIAAAKKVFKLKCFTTDQVKNLGLFFLTDEGRYNFYDAAYRHVSDIGNFKNLQSQLTDEYYITRFKAMLR